MERTSIRPTDDSTLAFRGAIFDLDGVLTSTEKLHKASFKIVHESIPGFLEAGGEYRDQEFEDYASAIARNEVFRLTLASRNIPFTEEQICQWARIKQDLYLQYLDEKDIDVYEKAIQFARRLKEEYGVPLAIGSTSENSPLVLEKTGLRSLFDVVVAGTTVITDQGCETAPLKGKPEPDIFLEASKRLRIEQKLCVGFGDADKDIIALVKADMFSVGLNRSNIAGKLVKAGANIVVNELDELPFEELDLAFKQHRALA